MAAGAARAVPVPDGSDDELADPWDQPAQDPWAAPLAGAHSHWATESSAVDASMQGVAWGSTLPSAPELSGVASGASGQGQGSIPFALPLLASLLFFTFRMGASGFFDWSADCCRS